MASLRVSRGPKQVSDGLAARSAEARSCSSWNVDGFTSSFTRTEASQRWPRGMACGSAVVFHVERRRAPEPRCQAARSRFSGHDSWLRTWGCSTWNLGAPWSRLHADLWSPCAEQGSDAGTFHVDRDGSSPALSWRRAGAHDAGKSDVHGVWFHVEQGVPSPSTHARRRLAVVRARRSPSGAWEPDAAASCGGLVRNREVRARSTWNVDAVGGRVAWRHRALAVGHEAVHVKLGGLQFMPCAEAPCGGEQSGACAASSVDAVGRRFTRRHRVVPRCRKRSTWNVDAVGCRFAQAPCSGKRSGGVPPGA